MPTSSRVRRGRPSQSDRDSCPRSHRRCSDCLLLILSTLHIMVIYDTTLYARASSRPLSSAEFREQESVDDSIPVLPAAIGEGRREDLSIAAVPHADHPFREGRRAVVEAGQASLPNFRRDSRLQLLFPLCPLSSSEILTALESAWPQSLPNGPHDERTPPQQACPVGHPLAPREQPQVQSLDS